MKNPCFYPLPASLVLLLAATLGGRAQALPALPPDELLYDTIRFRTGFSPTSVYDAWMGLRGNYLTYALGMPPGALVFYPAAAGPTTAPSSPQPHWAWPLRFYAWVSRTLPWWFFAASAAVLGIPAYRRPTDRLAVLALVHVAARRYVDWFDYHDGRN